MIMKICICIFVSENLYDALFAEIGDQESRTISLCEENVEGFHILEVLAAQSFSYSHAYSEVNACISMGLTT